MKIMAEKKIEAKACVCGKNYLRFYAMYPVLLIFMIWAKLSNIVICTI